MSMEANNTPGENELALETTNLCRIYKVGGQEIHALNNINISIPKGSYVALMGRSGSGKTTLLNCLSGLDHPTSGEVRSFGKVLTDLSLTRMVRFRRENIGFVFQSYGLLPTLSVFENVELMLRLVGAKAKARRERTNHCLDLVGLTKWRDHRPYELSGGQQQRVSIARALANHPKIILADEPTGELDSATARDILTLFRQIVADENVTLLMASHDQLVNDYVDFTLRMKDGVIISNPS